MSYRLESCSDLTKWTTLATVTAGPDGFCQHLVDVSDTTFYRYAFEPPAP
jgi:hypothetical protein